MTPSLLHSTKPWAALVRLALVTLLPATALAQTTLTVTDQQRVNGPNGHNVQDAISHADCIGDERFRYLVSAQNATGGDLQIWVAGTGNDCSIITSRNNDDRTCWLIDSRPAVNQPIRIELSARAIVSDNRQTNTVVTATEQDCNDTTFGSTGPQNLTLHFMIIDSSGVLMSTVATITLQADLLGPPAPSEVKAGVGEKRLVLRWDAPLANDRAGHRFYCDPKPGPVQTTMQLDGGIGPDSSGGIGGLGGIDGAAGIGGLGGIDGAGGTLNDAGLPIGGAGGAGGVTGGNLDGGGGNPGCPSTALLPGQRPNEEFRCGSVGPTAAQGEATGLVDYQLYAVGVAGHDRLGNAGPLSAIACGTPQEVDDFYEVYRRAGGAGGGGFCSLGREPAFGVGLLLGVAALARWIRRRRR